MGRGKLQSKPNKRQSRTQKGQKLKDEKSMHELNSSIDIRTIVKESSKRSTPAASQSNKLPKALTDLKHLAQKRALEQRNGTINNKYRKRLSPAELENILSGFESISVSEKSSEKPSTNMPSTNMPTANMPTANMPAAEIPNANMSTTEVPTTEMQTSEKIDVEIEV